MERGNWPCCRPRAADDREPAATWRFLRGQCSRSRGRGPSLWRSWPPGNGRPCAGGVRARRDRLRGPAPAPFPPGACRGRAPPLVGRGRGGVSARATPGIYSASSCTPRRGSCRRLVGAGGGACPCGERGHAEATARAGRDGVLRPARRSAHDACARASPNDESPGRAGGAGGRLRLPLALCRPLSHPVRNHAVGGARPG